MFENFLEVRYSAGSSEPPTRHPHAVFIVCVFLPLPTKIFLHKVKLPFLYWFPIAALTNYQKLIGSKQHKVIMWQFSRPEVWNQFNWAKVKRLAGLALSEVSRGECFFAFSSFWRPLAFFGSGLLSCITPTSCFHWHISYFLSAVKSLSLCLL